MIDRANDLPAKFTAAERRAYQWLWDCGFKFLVDLKTKAVATERLSYTSLVAFAKSAGWRDVNPHGFETFDRPGTK